MISLAFGYADDAPQPHDVPIAVVGSSAQASRVGHLLARSEPGAFRVRAALSQQTAREAILNQGLYGGLVIRAGRAPVILAASASGLTAERAVVTALTAVAPAKGPHPVVDDLAPLPPTDRSGLTCFVFELGLVFASLVFSIGVFIAGRAHRLWWRAAVAVIFALLVSLADTLGQYVVLGSLHAAPFGTYAIGVFGALTFALVIFTAHAFIGLPGTAPAAATFVFLGNAVSGGTVPRPFLANVYRQIATSIPNNAIVSAIRSNVYFGGRDLGHPLLILSMWTGAALLLLIAFDLLHTSEIRRTSRPAPDVYSTPVLHQLRKRRQRARHPEIVAS